MKAKDIVEAKERAVTTGSDLPNAERLASLLYGLAEGSTLDAHSLGDDDYIEDYLTISSVDPGVLWFEGGIGPLVVGEAASRLAKPGWSVNIVMGRAARKLARPRSRERLPELKMERGSELRVSISPAR